MAWASVQEVVDLTGQTLTTTQISVAQGVIELVADVTESADANLSPRDLRYLKMATAYQAVYMVSNAHADFFAQSDVSELDQDGVKFKYSDRQGGLLSVPAKRALEKLSWFGSGTIGVSAAKYRMTFAQYAAGMLTDQVLHPWYQDM